MKTLRLFVMLAVVASTWFACDIDRGWVNIQQVTDSIHNCSAPYIVSFHADVDAYDGSLDYFWDFGDGQTTYADSRPQHQYKEPGVYNVRLKVTNYDAEQTRTIVVDLQPQNTRPNASFDYKFRSITPYAPAEVLFTNTSLRTKNYFWNFGDGSGTNDYHTSHIYNQAGRYEVKLAASCSGDTSYSFAIFDILPPPSKFYLDSIYVWLPAAVMPVNVYYKVYFDIHLEMDTYTRPVEVRRPPVSWLVNDDFFFFDGQYDQTVVKFEIWDANDIFDPLYVFEFRLDELPRENYPDVLKWQSNNGFAAEVVLRYAQK